MNKSIDKLETQGNAILSHYVYHVFTERQESTCNNDLSIYDRKDPAAVKMLKEGEKW